MPKARIPTSAWIADQLAAFLAKRFNLPKRSFRAATDLLVSLGIGPAVFRALAAQLSDLPFMQQAGAKLPANAMNRVKTLSDLIGVVRQSLAAAAPPAERGAETRHPRGAQGPREPFPGPDLPLSDASRSAQRQRSASRPTRREKPSSGPDRIPRRKPDFSLTVNDLILEDASPSRKRQRSASRSTRGAKPSSSLDRIPYRKPRYANAALFEPSGERRLYQKRSLKPGQTVRLRLDIGERSSDSQVTGVKPLREDVLPDKDVDLDVMLSSTDFTVAVDPAALDLGEPRIANGGFLLPRDGGAAIARGGGKYLHFLLKAPKDRKRRGTLHARIGYYYRNILLQSQQLTAHMGEQGGFKITTDFSLSADLTGLGRLPDRRRISVFTNANDDGTHQIVFRHPGQPQPGADLNSTIAVERGKFEGPIDRLRKELEKNKPVEAKRSRDDLEDDLRRLAPIGRELYDLLPGQKGLGFFIDLMEHPEAHVVQILRPNTSSFVLPWSFIYEIPLSSGVEPKLCPIIAKWDGKTPLFEGAPRQCPCGPHDADILCPFGFWGYRYAIEQLAKSDKFVTEIVAAPNSDWVVGETQFEVDLKALAKHVAALKGSLGKFLPHATLREGKDRVTLETLLGKDIPFIYFYCHGNKRNVADANVCLAVGDDESITTSDVIGWPQKWYTKLKKVFWNEVRPLIFINACHSLAINPATLITYVDAFVGRGGAAGIIGTEVKVDQSLAMIVAETFWASWLSGADTVESALRAIRMDFLKQGNLFGLLYTHYCWSELKLKRAGSPGSSP